MAVYWNCWLGRTDVCLSVVFNRSRYGVLGFGMLVAVGYPSSFGSSSWLLSLRLTIVGLAPR